MTKHNILHKEYTLYERNYQLKFSMNIEAYIPLNDCVRLISQFVEKMDLTALYVTYERMPRANHASPTIMLKLILYALHERQEISSKVIEKNCRRDINYMYLLEDKLPSDHVTVARFRTKHFAACASWLHDQMTKRLIALGQITPTGDFIDGTKIEAGANRYTFVWKKAVTKHQSRCLQKTTFLVDEIIERYEMKPLWHKEVKKKHVKSLLKKLTAKASKE